MKSIISKTIIFIVILIIAFFIAKFLFNSKKTKNKLKNINITENENNLIEAFQSIDSDTINDDLKTVFGINFNKRKNIYDNNIQQGTYTIGDLNDTFLKVEPFIDFAKDEENIADMCLTKYVSLFNLLVTDSVIEINDDNSVATGSDISFNQTLENGFYGFSDSAVDYDPDTIAVVNFIFDNSQQQITTNYLNIDILNQLLDKGVSPPVREKFKKDGSSDDINNFMDFGIKGTGKKNFYVKNARYILINDEHIEIINAINNSSLDILKETTLDSMLLKPLIGDTGTTEANGIFALINKNINGQKLDGQRLDSGLLHTLNINSNYLDSADTDVSNDKLITKMYREYVIYCMELLYSKLALKLEANESRAVDLFGIDTSQNSNFEYVHTLLGNQNQNYITGFTSTIELEVNGFMRTTNINLSYFYHLVIVLLKLRTKIIKDKFLEKFSCKYLSYLFYSFHRVKIILGDYIESTSFDINEKNILYQFFDNYEFEGLYKLFIVSIKGPCNIFYEHETNSQNIRTGLTLEKIISSNTFRENLDFNTKNYFFFDEENTRKLNDECKKVKRENCTPQNTRGKCEWQATTDDHLVGECAATLNVSEKCMYLNEEKCRENNLCNWDGNICKPKPCINSDDKCLFDVSTDSVDALHCKQIIHSENGNIVKQCYDSERVMYTSKQGQDEKKDNPDSFFKNKESHFNRCEKDVYDSQSKKYKNNIESICNNNDTSDCNFLKSNNGTHNSSNFRTCVHDYLIDESNFFSCGDINDQQECDEKTTSNLSCFWQEGKCYNRDAPLHWVTPGENAYGLEDMTDCGNFNSEFSCPVDRCVWYGDECIRKENHPYYQTSNIVNAPPPVAPRIIPIKKEQVDCEAINNNKNSNKIDASIECNAFKCKWDSNEKVCLSKVGNSCSLHSSKTTCLDHTKNYDPVSQQNMCRWSDTNNLSNRCGDIEQKEDCNNQLLCEFNIDDNKCESKFDKDKVGFCTDTRMLQPCALFDAQRCPTEEKVDNMGNKIHGSNHCKLVNDSCVNNLSVFTKDNYNDCHYNYLNTGTCDQENCRLTQLYDSKRDSLNITKCVPREKMPCSMLNEDECKNSEIVNDICYWSGKDSKCMPTQNMKTLTDLLTNVADIGNDDYKQIQQITSEFDDINFVTRENKKYYMRDIEPIQGLITKIVKKGATDVTQLIYTNTNLVNKITEGDLIEIESSLSSSFSVKPDTKLNQFKVKSVDVYDKIIEIEGITSGNPIVYINDESEISINNTTLANVKWIIRNPSLGLFGSYQHSQAMMDSVKINDFYNNFF